MRERRFPESYTAFVGLVGLVTCQVATLLRIFFCEVEICGPPGLVVALLPVVQNFGSEQVAGVHLCHKVAQFLGLGDCNPMVPAFDLAPVQLAGKGCDVGVGRVAPGIEEVRLCGELFLGRDDFPGLELLDYCPIFLVFVTNVGLFYMFYVLRVNGRNDGFDRHVTNYLLKSVLLPVYLVILLDLEEIVPLGVVLNFWIEELSMFDAPSFEVLDSGGKTHFGLGEHKREETVIFAPFGGSKIAHKCHELVGEMSNGFEGGMSHYCV